MNNGYFDINKAADCLSSSFMSYPVFVYLFPDITARRMKLKKVMTFLIKLAQKKGEVISFPNCEKCISIWYFPYNKSISFTDAVQAGIIQLIFALGIKDFRKFMKLKNFRYDIRNGLLKNNKYYFLDMIGVNPDYQKKGLASSLLDNKLKAIKNAGVKCYLETSNKENIAFYNKYGFKIIYEYVYDGLPVYSLLTD
ncbi:MAG: GNAT family N-acetyltransferase [Bacteroidetes bacterium]|nr:GNAT family N-acetyltransferase [Bacteroidota bacterium]